MSKGVDPGFDAFDQVGLALARIQADGTIIEANHAFADLLAMSPAELAGRPMLDLVQSDDAQAIRSGRLTSFRSGAVRAEVRWIRGDGRELWARSSISAGKEGDILYLTLEDIDELKVREADLELRLLHDQLTGLPALALFKDRVSQAVIAAGREGRGVGCIAFDLLKFRDVNRRHGFEAGDEVLKMLATRFRDRLRASDTVARVGADEFAIMLPGIDGRAEAEGVARQLLESLQAPVAIGEEDLKLEARSGVSVFPEDAQTAEELIHRAEMALHLSQPAAGVPGVIGEPFLDDDHPDVDHRLQVLEPVSAFRSVPDQVLRRLARYLGEQDAAAGSPLGDPALRIVREGVVEVTAEAAAGPLTLLTLGPGELLGTEAMVADGVELQTRALSDVKLLVLDPSHLAHLAPDDSELQKALRQAGHQRNRQVKAILNRPARKPGAGAGRIALYSTKGGSGRTTMSINLAAELAARHPGEVLLVDLSLPFNHVALLANLIPGSCLARLGNFYAEAFPGMLWSTMLPHPSGFMVLPTAIRPEEAELVDATLVKRMLDVVSPHYRHILFDLSATLDESVLNVLESSDHLVMVTAPELAAMHDTRQVLDIANRVLHIPTGQVHILLNHRSATSAMTKADVERVLNRSVTSEIRYLGARPELIGMQGGLLASERGHPLAKAMKELAGKVSKQGLPSAWRA